MKKKNSIGLLLLVVLSAIFLIYWYADPKKDPVKKAKPAVPTIVQSPAIKQYVSLMEQYIDSTATVGAALTIVQDGQIVVQKAYGVRKEGTRDSVDIHTVFRLASCSKGFAGILSCLLEKDSILSLDDRIKKFLPGFRLKDSVNTEQLTLKNTLSHTSGLVPHAYDDLIEDGVPYRVILDKLADVTISAAPGKLYGYQNVVFSLIDTVTKTITGTSYQDLLAKYIFNPLHMEDASASPDIFLNDTNNFAYPHKNLGKQQYKALAVNLGYYNTAPAAGVNVSISDLSKWLLALLGNNPGVLSPDILKEIQTPVIISPLRLKYTIHWGKLDSKEYGLGWRIYEFMGRKIVYHGGYVKGYRSEIAFCPETNTGIAFVENSPNYVSSISIPTFFRMYFNELDSVPAEGVEFKKFEWDDDSLKNQTEGGSN